MSKNIVLSEFVRRSVALTVVLGASVAVMGAQTPTADTSSTVTVTATPQYSSSVSAEDVAPAANATAPNAGSQLASNALHLNLFGNAMQYGGRQSYGRPRYRGSNTNSDGSPKWDFYVGAGVTLPLQDTKTNFTDSWGIQAGGGRMFNKNFGLNLEFDYDKFGMTGYTLSDYLYTNTGSTVNSYGLDGNAHVISLSIQPIYNIRSGQGVGAYITGGVGYYHKVSNFTLPGTGYYCDYYGYCYQYTANQVIDHYTSNAPGFNGGVGITYKFSRFSNQVLYAEGRYVFVDNSFKAGATDSNYMTYRGDNYFPGNSLHTSYFPIKFGLRF